jgi:hypothetical protein
MIGITMNDKLIYRCRVSRRGPYAEILDTWEVSIRYHIETKEPDEEWEVWGARLYIEKEPAADSAPIAYNLVELLSCEVLDELRRLAVRSFETEPVEQPVSVHDVN